MWPRQAVRALLLVPRLLAAQGGTTAAIQGRVAGDDGSPVGGASVTVINTSDGRRWSLATTSGGRYAIEVVAIGGPYRIEVRALGFAPEARGGITLALGQRLIADFILEPAAVQLAGVTVSAHGDAVLNPGRTGPAEIVPAAKLAAMPNVGRTLTSVTLLSPQVAISPTARFGNETFTVAGQPRWLNGFQIDGGTNIDLYSGRMYPGLQTLPRPISLETIEQIEVLAAPMDVRHGGFSAGLVNAVTKSGTNTVHGSLFSYLANADLMGRSVTGARAANFSLWQYGGSIGGPIVRDRVHYFVSADIYRRSLPDVGPLITDTTGGADLARIGIRYASAVRFQEILRNTYGLDPGTLGPYLGSAPAADFFGKITTELGPRHHLDLSHHFADGERHTYLVRQYGTYYLSSIAERVPAIDQATRLQLTSLLGNRWSNELVASHLRLGDACHPNVSYPVIRVKVDAGLVVGGTDITCPNSSRQHAFELTDNVTVGVGTHLVTMGVHGEALRFTDTQMPYRSGQWDFSSLDSLEAGRAFHYQRTMPAAGIAPGIHFGARELGVYLQDRWRPVAPITITSGLRVDVPLLPDAVGANAVLRDSLGADNGRLPSGRPLWSPRLAVNYDVGGAGRTFLRAGVGLFTGRPAYTSIASAYRDNGTRQLFLNCNGRDTPPFDPVNQPATCGAGPIAQLSFFDPGARFPQSLKSFFGIDRMLPADVVATVDVLYTRAWHQFYFSDPNLRDPVGFARGEGNRPLYGTVGPSGGFTTARRAPALGEVVRASDRRGDHTFSLGTKVRKRFADRAEVSALYARTRARDRLSMGAAPARQSLEATPLDGTFADRRLSISTFEIPHRVELDAAARLPWQIWGALRYAGASGTAYTYVVRGDANGDGIGPGTFPNDAVYVPRDSADIALADESQWKTLNEYIERESCLRRQRGRLLARNSCRKPWFGTLDARATKSFRIREGHSLQLAADLYNALNLLHRAWGQYRVTAYDAGVPLLSIVGYDAAAGRGVYRLQLPGFRRVQDPASRWQLELSARYGF